MSGEPTGRGGGIVGSARRLLVSASDFLATKLELVGVELQEEKRRILDLLVLTAVGIALFLLGLTVLTLAIVFFFWQTTEYRITALGVVGLVYLLIAGGFFAYVQRQARLSSRIFEASVEELRKDIDWVKSHLK